jgi:hypothetical protein
MTEPFPPESVLYRFMPTEEERAGYQADEYALVRDTENVFGFCLWVRYRSLWQVGYHGERTIIAHLLTERAEIKATVQALEQANESLLQQRNMEWDRRKQATTARQQAEAERDVYRQALEKYSERQAWGHMFYDDPEEAYRDCWIESGNGYDLASVALAQGRKLREGE